MSDDRPPLAAFEDATFEAIATETDRDSDALRDLVARHQATVRELPGVEDVVYEWRSQFHEDPLVHRRSAVYVLVHRPHVWTEYAEALALDDDELAALRAVHAHQAEALVPAGGRDRLADGDPMVLTRP